MGHLSSNYGIYSNLQKRLDQVPMGVPPQKELFEILKILFTEEEALVASQMPIKLSKLDFISRRVCRSKPVLFKLLEKMAGKGLVMDIEINGQSHYMLNPLVIGFFEFMFMRVRKDIPQKKLAYLAWDYMFENADVLKKMFSTETPPVRTLIHDNAISKGIQTEVLTYETASGLLEEAELIAVGLCTCRHVMSHKGMDCKYPMEVCTAINEGAEYLIRRGIMRKISKSEAKDIFKQTQELGLVCIADNVKNKPGFICNCCGCCCGILGAYKKFQIQTAVATSSYIAHIDSEECTGCGACVKRCQIDVIQLSEKSKNKKVATVKEDMCLGCGACISSCKFKALTMEKKKKRIITPDNVMEKFLLLSIEKGTLGSAMFDDFTSFPHTLMRSFVNAFTKLPPVKRLLVSKKVKSKFLEKMTDSFA